jgi:hypothetical protein
MEAMGPGEVQPRILRRSAPQDDNLGVADPSSPSAVLRVLRMTAVG